MLPLAANLVLAKFLQHMVTSGSKKQKQDCVGQNANSRPRNHGCTILSGYSVFGGPLFIPIKAAEWHMKPKMTDFPGLKIPGSSATSMVTAHPAGLLKHQSTGQSVTSQMLRPLFPVYGDDPFLLHISQHPTT